MILIKHADGRTTEIETGVSREETLAKIAEAIDGNDWGYAEDRIAAMNLGIDGRSTEVAEIHSETPRPLGGTHIGVIRLAPYIEVGSRVRYEREIRIHLGGDSLNNPSYVETESIAYAEEIAR